MNRSLLSVLVPALLLCTPSLFAADLPTGESIFSKSIEKSGGAAAYAKIKNSVLTGSLSMPAQNMSGSLKIYSEGEKNYTVVDLPGVGKVEDGSDGDTAWEINALQGPRIKEGAEKVALRNANSISMIKDWRDRFKELKTLGAEDVDGKPNYKVEVTPKEGKPMTIFFDQESGLITKLSMVVSTPVGEIPAETTLSDYKSVSGVMTPMTMTQKVMTANIVTHFDHVEYNAEIPKDRFELPATIKALKDKKK